MEQETKEYTCTTEKGTLTVMHYSMKYARQFFYDHDELNYQGQEIHEQFLYNGIYSFEPTKHA